ncbi:Holliday junction branch migration protein RuvA [Gudongella sp. DL1XJH-153]|uniref:Holliday junction branch migration protein RuvA n=1 Tax=Gudongella sp. DL1XJH-153 TaxID=3409804 RepID=UPI003BB5CA86
MIDYIIGRINYIGEEYFLLENQGMGYRINSSTNTLIQLGRGDGEQHIFTNLIVREDSISLYGFISEDEMNMFKLLLNVSKIGPKVACGILSTLRPSQIQKAILLKDIGTLCKGPGVGRKTAERIVLELKDKVKGSFVDEESFDEIMEPMDNEAVEALMVLGYSRYEAQRVFQGTDISGLSVEDMIKLGLRKLSRQ